MHALVSQITSTLAGRDALVVTRMKICGRESAGQYERAGVPARLLRNTVNPVYSLDPATPFDLSQRGRQQRRAAALPMWRR